MKHLVPVLFIAILLVACGGQEQAPTEDATPPQDTLARTPESMGDGPAVAPVDKNYAGPIRLVRAKDGAAPDRVDMALTTVTDDASMTARFEYAINGFDLKAQTADAAERNCANSADGQHIHFILNNKPYLAKYDPVFKETMDPGNNVLLSFLSRSYHESLKGGGAYTLSQIAMPGEGGVPQVDLEKDVILFYSRPKGDYKKSQGDRVLLDFYLVNCTLSPDGNRVRATIDGVPFLIDNWSPYFIEGLELGEHTVRLELLDAKGMPVPGPFNDSGVRTFGLMEG